MCGKENRLTFLHSQGLLVSIFGNISYKSPGNKSIQPFDVLGLLLAFFLPC